MRKIFGVIWFLGMLQLALSAQVNPLFQRVNEEQSQRLGHIFSDQRDSVFAAFDVSIDALFASTASCETLPDTSRYYFLVDALSDVTAGQTLAYAFINNIVICTAGQLKVYSWDNLDGGNYHTYTNYLQYMADDGTCTAVLIDTAETSDEVGYFRMEPIKAANRELYLLFGYGTYGGGEQHYLFEVFELKNGHLEECMGCYPDGKAIKVGCFRGQSIDLRYNRRKQILSFKAYTFGDGFYTEDFKPVALKFQAGKWVAQ